MRTKKKINNINKILTKSKSLKITQNLANHMIIIAHE